MDLEEKDYGYNEFKKQGTGGHEQAVDYKIVVYPFGKYQIKVKLASDNKFIEIIEVKLNKEFLSHKQKIASSGVHDVDKFYRE